MTTDESWDAALVAIRERMSALGWRQADLARAAAVSKNTVSDLLAGNRRPYRPTRAAVSEALWQDADHLDGLLDPRRGRDSRPAAAASLKAGAAPVEVWDDLVGDAPAIVAERAREEHSVLEQVVVAHLRRIGIEPRFPRPRPGVPYIPDLEFDHDGRTHLVEVRSATNTARFRDFTATVGALLLTGRAVDQLGGLWIILDEPLPDDQREAAEDLGIHVVHIGDWSPLDEAVT